VPARIEQKGIFMNLSIDYLGLQLASPLMPGASPLVDDMDMVRRLEDCGASAIVMHSLFEEQIVGEHLGTIYQMSVFSDSYAEALSYFPKRDEFALDRHTYLEQVRKIKDAVSVPVIASLNGCTPGGWIDYAKLIQQAGADALELNVYHVATNASESGTALEDRVLAVTRAVRAAITIPFAVKLSPFYSSLPNLCSRLDDAGADGFIVFNRFYQPDVDLDSLEVVPKLHLSTPEELTLRLRWAAILHSQTEKSIGISGGVHGAAEAVKSIMVGASAVQIVSAILKHGPEQLKRIERGLREWMEKNEYHSVRTLRGCLSHNHCPDPQAFERGNYMRLLQTKLPLHFWQI
jgi:dihydroorotate dehydrogenase (fumarate)